MRKNTFTILLAWFLSYALAAFPVMAGLNDRDSGINLTKKNYVEIPQISAPAGNPKGNYGWLYVKDSSGTTKLYFEDDAGSVHDLITAAGGNTLDQSYDQGGAGVGRTITVDQGAVQLNGSHATNDTFFINKTTGSGHSMQITNAGTGYDINGTSGTWYITKAGVATFASLAGLTSGVTITGGAIGLNSSSNYAVSIANGTSTGTVSIGGGLNSVGINSSSWDITTAGAMSGFTSLSLSDDITMANGKAVKSSVTTGETIAIQAYDVDGAAYVNSILLTNGNTPAIAIGTNAETVAINSADWDISATGAMTGIGAITMDGLLTGTLGATISGATINLNASSNNAVNIGTGTTTSTVTIGGAGVQSIDIGNGAAAKTVTLGSTNTTSTTTINAGSGNINLVGTLATGDAITGDGTAALGGFLKTVTDDADGRNIIVSESGTYITNAGAGGPMAYNLPAAAAGLNYCFVVMAAQELRVTPAADDVVNIAGTAGDAAEYWTANAVGEVLCVTAVDGTNWIATSYTGTWTQQNP